MKSQNRIKTHINIFNKLNSVNAKKKVIHLEEQFLDQSFYAVSSIYRQSRKIYLEMGGIYVPSFVSIERYKNQKKKNDMKIEYNPVHSECERAILLKTNDQFSYFEYLNKLSTPIFHEQNFHILKRKYGFILKENEIIYLVNLFDKIFQKEVEIFLGSDVTGFGCFRSE